MARRSLKNPPVGPLASVEHAPREGALGPECALYRAHPLPSPGCQHGETRQATPPGDAVPSPAREGSAPDRQATAPGDEVPSPAREVTAPNDALPSPAREVPAPD